MTLHLQSRRASKADKAGASQAPCAFDLLVSLYDTTPQGFSFDQERVVVGRGADVDLQITHAAVARRQFTIERVIPPRGTPRFRVVPQTSINPVLRNGKPAVEGALVFGDALAVAEVRVTLRRPLPARKKPSGVRVAIVALSALALVSTLFLFTDRLASNRVAMTNEGLFAHLPEVGCEEPRQCSERAKLAYAHGKTYAKQGASVPGNWYRAAIEFYRAEGFQKAAGQTVPGLEDVRTRLRETSETAEAHFNDLLFRMNRQSEAGDLSAVTRTIAEIEAMVPDEDHPIRVRLAEYRREHSILRDMGP
jgi:hypothetical protein